MYNSQDFEDFESLYNETIDTIVKFREKAEEIREKMDAIIDACETIEGEI